MISAFAAGSKQLGVQQSPETGEKITDGARGAFEKATGYELCSVFHLP